MRSDPPVEPIAMKLIQHVRRIPNVAKNGSSLFIRNNALPAVHLAGVVRLWPRLQAKSRMMADKLHTGARIAMSLEQSLEDSAGYCRVQRALLKE